MKENSCDTSTQIKPAKKYLSFRKLILSENQRRVADPNCLTDSFLREILEKPPTGFRTKTEYNPNRKKRINTGLSEYWSKPENRLRASENIKKRYEDPEQRKKISLGNIRRYSRYEERIKSSLAAKGKKTKTGSKEKMTEIAIGGFWYGNIRYYSGPQYCEKWNADLKERVRAFFGYCCVECGTPQNGRKLHVHHVWYNKAACCDDTPRSLVPLCHGCHSATTSKNNRIYWSQHFQSMIDNFYEGRCWLTKDEMDIVKKVGL